MRPWPAPLSLLSVLALDIALTAGAVAVVLAACLAHVPVILDKARTTEVFLGMGIGRDEIVERIALTGDFAEGSQDHEIPSAVRKLKFQPRWRTGAGVRPGRRLGSRIAVSACHLPRECRSDHRDVALRLAQTATRLVGTAARCNESRRRTTPFGLSR